MEEKKQKRSRSLGLLVPIDDADVLIKEADGSSALLYLYLLREGTMPIAAEVARVLKMTEREITSSLARLRELGLIEPSETKILRPAVEPPEFTSREIAARSRDDAEFRAVVLETQRVFGKMLTGADLKILYGLYDHLSLPAEVLLLLINHCVGEFRSEYGEGRLPTLKRIEREGYVWSDEGILTLEMAETYIKQKQTRRDSVSKISAALGIRGRILSPTERKYIESWTGMGFDAEALGVAYDKTVVKTGSLQWKYMNSIVENWHSKGLHTLKEIEGHVSPPDKSRKSATAPAPSAPKQKGELERMKKILNFVQNNSTEKDD